MNNTLFFPAVRYLKTISSDTFMSLEDLCARAQVICRASGLWTQRRICVIRGPSAAIDCEPGDWGSVQITVPSSVKNEDVYRYALAAMAYGVFDLVARESIKGASSVVLTPPPGRKPTGMAMSNAERQRRHRIKHAQAVTKSV